MKIVQLREDGSESEATGNDTVSVCFPLNITRLLLVSGSLICKYLHGNCLD